MIKLKFVIFVLLFPSYEFRSNFRTYGKRELDSLRDRVSSMFHHAYDGYLNYAYPYDELRPLSCDGVDTWGSYSLTLIDALDTLAIMGNFTEFRRVYNLLANERTDFDANINVSVFETNIRIVGGLLSAHLLAFKAGVDLEPGWPCNGPLLRLAEDAATRLLPAFDTATGMPFGTVNLRHGVPYGETSITCTAGVGTFLVEFGTLSRLTGNLIFEKTAMRAMDALWHQRSSIGLLGNHIDVATGKWTATDAGIGAGVDSYYEYLVKGAILLQRPELMQMFKLSKEAIEQFLNHDDWHFWVTMKQGTVTMPVFQSLEAFWPGILSLTGDNIGALKAIHNYHQVWKQYGFLPEFYNVAQNLASTKREGYPLRPELIESAMYLYRATRDPFLLNLGEDMLESIEFSARTACGYATVKDVRDHSLEDRMESFFLSETTKYLYLLFDTENFIHNNGARGTIFNGPRGQCVIDSGGYIFNTEAHPMDPGLLECCTGPTEDDLISHLSGALRETLGTEYRGDTISARLLEIEARQREDALRKQLKDLEAKKMAFERRQKEKEAIERKKALERLREEKSKLEDEESILSQFVNSSLNTSDILPSEETIKNIKGFDSSVANIDALALEIETGNDSPHPSENIHGDLNVDGSNVNQQPNESETETQNSPEFSTLLTTDNHLEKDQEAPLLIKRQSKDEAIEEIPTTQSGEKKSVGGSDPLQVLHALNSLIKQILPSSSSSSQQKFDLEDFKSRLWLDALYPINKSWSEDHSVMVCPAKHFFERFSVLGEFFEQHN